MGRRYYIWTIGCQMNEADSLRVASAMEQVGLQPATRAEEADLIVLNTCVVRQSAEDKAVGRLSSLRPLKARRPDALIAVMGCLVGIRAEEAAASLRDRFPWVDVFLPPSEPGGLLDALAERGWADEGRALQAERGVSRAAPGRGDLPLPASARGRTVSAYVSAVLGCSNACSYCVIPHRRGPERSRPAEAILAEAETLVHQGIREITLLGQIVDRYGYDLLPAEGRCRERPAPLVSLLERLNGVQGLERIRFLTSHPRWMSEDLLDAVARLPRVCEHFELPVQAGDDEVLARMRRGYRADDYRQLAARIRERIPNVSIATDVIVGFPGETEAQFRRTFELLAELRLDKAHIARYSPRPQTIAARRYPDDVPLAEKERRRQALDELQARIVSEINAQWLGQTLEVLVEGRKKGRWWGRTRNDRLVFFSDAHGARADRLGQLAQVRITWTGPWSLVGTGL